MYQTPTRPSLFKGKFLVFLVSLFLVGSIVFLSRDFLLIKGVDYLLGSIFPKSKTHKVTYDQAYWEGRRVIISGMHLTEENHEVTIDRLEVDFHFNLKKLLLEPHLKLIHPQIRVHTTHGETQSTNALGILLPSHYFCLKLDVQNGVLQIDNQRLYFTFQKKEELGELGTLYVTHDPSLIKDSYLVADFKVYENKLYCGLNIEQMGSERILQLFSFIEPKFTSEWENAGGQTQLKGKAIINFSGEVEEIACQFSIQNLEISNPQKRLFARAQSFQGNFSYPVINADRQNEALPWKQMLSLMHLDNGEIHVFDQWNLVNLRGKLVLDPAEDPLLEMTGDLQTETHPLKFVLEGKGALHEDDSFWLELAARLSESKDKEALLNLSLCSPEKESFVIQTEFSEMFGQQLDIFRVLLSSAYPELNKSKILDGAFRGKGMAWFEKSQLSHIEVEHFSGDKIVVSISENALFECEKLKLDGRLNQVFPQLNGELNLEALLQIPIEEIQLKNPSHLVSTVKWRKGTSKVTGSFSVQDPNDIIQFGFESPQLFPTELKKIKEGWFHSALLAPAIYQPLLKRFVKDMDLQGELDVCGTFDGNELQLSLQANHLSASFPSLDIAIDALGEKDPMLLKTEGRAKFNFDVGTGRFEGKIPLKAAKVLSRELQMLLDHIDGDLHISTLGLENKIQGKFRHADLKVPNQTLLENCEFAFHYDGNKEDLIFENIIGKIGVYSETPSYLNARIFHLKNENSVLDAKIVQNGKELIIVKALAPTGFQEWKAQVTLTNGMPVQGNFDAYVFCDPSKSFLSIESFGHDLDLYGKSITEFAMAVKKQGNRWLIDQIKADDFVFKSTGIYENQILYLNQFDVQFKKTTLQGSANVALEPQNAGHDWGVQAEMTFDLASASPLPLHLHVRPGMKLAFSPRSGLVMTDIGLSGENSECVIEYLEYLPKTQRWKLQNCKSLLSQEFVQKLVKLESMPKSFQNFVLKQPLRTLFNLNVEKQNISVLGKLFKAFYWTEEQQDLVFFFERGERKGKLMLQEATRDERMQLDLSFAPEGDVSIEKVTGSLSGLSLHLKRDESSKGFNGEAKIDFTSFNALLPKEYKEKITEMKLGKGYQLQGQFLIPPQGLKSFKFQGKLIGEEFECLGHQLKKLEAKANISSKEAVIENLHVKDEAGMLNVKKIHFVRSSIEDHWAFTIPIVSIQELVPHLLTKEEAKNMVIKQASITNFSGELGNVSGFQGEGSFLFINRTKKDFSLFDVPFEIIKNLGLDPGLLTPVSGEVNFELQQGKCIITKLKNVRSEGGRSEFYLPSAPMTSYLDLNGNVYIDLKMKQNVLLNLTEPFTLSIRGTFKEPRYMLR